MKSEILTIVGYVIGMMVTPVVGGWASTWFGGSAVFVMVDLLFGLALLVALVRLPFRFLAARRAKASAATPVS
ncbi:hypothetical protein E1286_04315 [Nonomuraea terrae]|uniref:Uncharacterized protein n=1 Tax=Nonomuraea terrae TaxID=2530383 RepID=A0A4R4Z9N0_9ACTN|nr:hypothetical protein [Nonomuraea terrae]TDD54943.1 hypothetical protein E1286_04315 [Nonomuraea terrae]